MRREREREREREKERERERRNRECLLHVRIPNRLTCKHVC